MVARILRKYTYIPPRIQGTGCCSALKKVGLAMAVQVSYFALASGLPDVTACTEALSQAGFPAVANFTLQQPSK